MESREFARKCAAFVALIAIAAAILIVTPPSMRLVAALIALPVETLILTAIVGGSDRRVPQP